MSTVIAGIAPLVSRYDLFLCDIWGVVHNGRTAYADAVDALIRSRAAGVTVILISNAPRPGAVVEQQMKSYGVAGPCYDLVVTSGDITREELAARPGARVFHLGPERDLPNYEGLALTLVPLAEADIVVCTGLFDDTRETPADYVKMLADIRARGLLMLCANPDIVVERGSELVWCAGALARDYAALGGEVLFAGKPFPVVYRAALSHAETIRGRAVDRSRVLAVGDGVRTDLAGAAREGFDCLFVADGIHAEDLGSTADTNPDPARFAQVFAEAAASPVAVIKKLVW